MASDASNHDICASWRNCKVCEAKAHALRTGLFGKLVLSLHVPSINNQAKEEPGCNAHHSRASKIYVKTATLQRIDEHDSLDSLHMWAYQIALLPIWLGATLRISFSSLDLLFSTAC